jgi:hypothetical protein
MCGLFRHLLARFAVSLSLLMLLLCPALAAQAIYEDAPVAGGTKALSQAMGLDPGPERARVITELPRLIYDTPERTNATTDALLFKLSQHLNGVDRLQSALAEVQSADGTITIAGTTRQAGPKRLERFLDLIGLKLSGDGKAIVVERSGDPRSAERAKFVAHLGIDIKELAVRLNRGEAARISLVTESVPIPLPARIWSQAVFKRPIDRDRLFSAVMRNRQAALLAHGLSGLDDETLKYLAERPAIVTDLYERSAGSFAAFAGGLHIRHGMLAVPGGESAASLWEAVVEESPSRPDRFIPELFNRRDGRVAYLYDSLAYLDAPTTAFALGLWMNDAGLRVERFKTLVSNLEQFPGWVVPQRPFGRPSEDPILALTRVVVEPTGTPRAPLWRTFWARVFGGLDLPADPGHELRAVREDGAIDAAWLAGALLAEQPRFRGERLDQFAFGQRVFGGIEETDLPDALVALRAFPRYRMLLLTLERIGIRSPAVYASAARHAQRLTSSSPQDAGVALSQFQGSLALIARMVRSRALEPALAETLVASLATVPVRENGRYRGGIARWIQQALAPAIEADPDDIDKALVSALAGLRANAEVPSILVSWEGRTYRVDIAAAEARRLTEIVQKFRAERVGGALALERIAEPLDAPTVTLDDVQTSSSALAELARSLGQPPDRKAHVDPRRDTQRIAAQAIRELSRINGPNGLKTSARIAGSLLDLVDDLLADALVALTYALDLGDPAGTALAAGNISRRHDFGPTEKVDQFRRRAAWAEPIQRIDPGVPWHVTGSLLGLDLALSTLALRRFSSDSLPEAPVLRLTERDTFAKTVALLNPFDLRDADRDGIVEAVERGRQRILALDPSGEGFDALADEIVMDGWRRRGVRWALVNDAQQVLSFFSMTDFLYLGRPPSNVALDRWGMASDSYDGCLCTRMPRPGRWNIVVGRQRLGVLSTQVADLNLRVALALHDLNLPASLAKDVLATATQDYVDTVKPLHANDWLTFVRSAQRPSIERIEDYVAMLTANGPLIPERDARAAGRTQ